MRVIVLCALNPSPHCVGGCVAIILPSVRGPSFLLRAPRPRAARSRSALLAAPLLPHAHTHHRASIHFESKIQTSPPLRKWSAHHIRTSLAL